MKYTKEDALQALEDLDEYVTNFGWVGGPLSDPTRPYDVLKTFIEEVCVPTTKPFGYFHELLDHEGKGEGVWFGSYERSVTEQSYIEGEVGKEIVTLYAAPLLQGEQCIVSLRAVLQKELADQEKHYGEVAACASAGSRLHKGERDCTEGVIKGLEYCISMLDELAAPATPAQLESKDAQSALAHFAKLDRSYYAVWRKDIGGFVGGNVPVTSIVALIESYRAHLNAIAASKSNGGWICTHERNS